MELKWSPLDAMSSTQRQQPVRRGGKTVKSSTVYAVASQDGDWNEWITGTDRQKKIKVVKAEEVNTKGNAKQQGLVVTRPSECSEQEELVLQLHAQKSQAPN